MGAQRSVSATVRVTDPHRGMAAPAGERALVGDGRGARQAVSLPVDSLDWRFSGYVLLRHFGEWLRRRHRGSGEGCYRDPERQAGLCSQDPGCGGCPRGCSQGDAVGLLRMLRTADAALNRLFI